MLPFATQILCVVIGVCVKEAVEIIVSNRK